MDSSHTCHVDRHRTVSTLVEYGKEPATYHPRLARRHTHCDGLFCRDVLAWHHCCEGWIDGTLGISEQFLYPCIGWRIWHIYAGSGTGSLRGGDSSGCAVGIVAGSLLPQPMVTALSMSLYGMFLAIIIPPAHKDRNVLYALITSFVLSGLCAVAPVIGEWSSGMRTVVLTIVISAVAAWLKPIKTDDDGAA